MNKINSTKKIYILSGGDSFINSTALIYKRNLMYVSFICICLSYLGKNQSFESLLGFHLVKEVVTSKSVISILMAVVLYELIMLWVHFKHCKSQWFNKNITSNDQIYILKSGLNQKLTDANDNDEYDLYTRIESKIIDIYQTRKETTDGLISKLNDLKEIGVDIIDMLDRHIDIAEELIEPYDHGKFSEFSIQFRDQYILVEQKVRAINEINDYLKNSNEENLENNKWFIEMTENLKCLKDNYRNSLEKTNELAGGYRKSFWFDFCLPTLISIISIGYSLYTFYYLK